MRRLLLIVCLLTTAAFGQSWSGILSNTRAADWSLAGLPATYPNGETTPNAWTPPTRSTICSTISSGASSATIQSALNACPARGVVLLSAGTYSGISVTVPSNVTLRGSGASTTKLTGSSLHVGPGLGWGGATLLTQNPTKFFPTVNVASPPSSGILAALTQCDDGKSAADATFTKFGAAQCNIGTYSDPRGPWVCGLSSNEGNPCNGNITGSTNQHHQSHILWINGVSGSTVTFSSPLENANWSTGRSAALTWLAATATVGAGIESLSIEGSVSFTGTYGCWIKGIRLITNSKSIGIGQFKFDSHSLFANSYIGSTQGGPGGGVNNGMELIQWGSDNDAQGVSDHLFINNIIDGGTTYGLGEQVNNVYAYNYWRTANNNGFLENGISQHHAGVSFALAEGNDMGWYQDDNAWGTHNFTTMFRTWVSGVDPTYPSLSNDSLSFDSFSRFSNAIGNVLGNNAYVNNGGYLNAFAYNRRGLDTTGLTLNSAMRWGNYVQGCTGNGHCNVQSFDSAEVPTNLSNAATVNGVVTATPNSVPYQNTVPASTNLPASFFMYTITAHPNGGTGLSWWKTCASWTTFPTNCATSSTPPMPPVHPESIGGPFMNGHVDKIPARVAWENLPADSSYPTAWGVNLRQFDERVYTADGAGTGSTPPGATITAPSGGTTASGTITITATATAGTFPVAGVSFFANGALIGTEDTTSPYSASWDTTLTPNSNYTLVARARDTSGNTGDSAGVSVTVSNAQTLGSITLACSDNCNTDGINQTLVASGTNGRVGADCFDTTAVKMTCPALTFASSNAAIATVVSAGACGVPLTDWCGTVTPRQAGTSQITAASGAITSPAMTVTVTPTSSTMLLSKQTGSRYLYANGHAVMLSGGHTFNDVQDVSTQNTGTINAYIDFPGYLAWLKGFGHNYLRLWVNIVYKGSPNGNFTETNVPLPYARCDDAGATACPNGTLASDGLKKFDLNTFNPVYFNSLVSRVAQAQAQGFYVSDMLFNAWSEFDGCEIGMSPCGNPWTNHPYRSANNIQGFNGDTLGTNDGWAMYNNPSFTSPTVWAKMQLLIHHHVDLLHTYDNVMFEPSNEPTYAFSAESGFTYAKILAWGNLVASDIASYETAQGYVHHPVFVEAFAGDTITGAALTTRTNTLPPTVTTSGVVTMIDTDHMTDVAGGVTVDATWKRFTRGPGIMALLDPPAGQPETSTDPVRRAYGNIRSYANRMVLDAGRTVPWDNTVSNGGSGKCTTAFCLVDPGHTYLMYYPSGGSASLTITTVDAGGCEWFNAATGTVYSGGCTFQPVNADGTAKSFTYVAPAGCTQCVLFVGGSGPIPDTTPPVASFLSAPVDGSNVEGTYTITVQATDNVQVQTVGFTVDGVARGLSTTCSGTPCNIYTFTFTTTDYAVSPPPHTLGCYAFDTSNLQSFCANRSVNVIVTPPPPPGTPGGPSTIKGSIMMGGRVK